MSKVLVTGGAGFIGSHVVDSLINQNHEVVVVDNLSTGKLEYVNHKAIFYEADILKDLPQILASENPDIVIHMAANAMLRKSIEDPIFDATLNILGTISVLEACRAQGIKKLIYTSTGGARVGEPVYLPVDEAHPIRPLSPYGISKHTAEHYVEMYSEVYGLDYLIFCFGNVYGPRDNPKCGRLASVFIEKMINNESPTIFGDGLNTRDFIYVEDLADFIVNSIDKNPEHKLFHLADGKQVSVNEITENLKEITKFQGEIKHIEAIKGEVRDIVLDTTFAKKELGWSPKHSLREGLEKTHDWFLKQRNGLRQ